ncbi:MAG: hypothetical protein JWP29_3529 [Rhodoferax sp.]|nr:hypothetical protein [Rhodoferax sp.]
MLPFPIGFFTAPPIVAAANLSVSSGAQAPGLQMSFDANLPTSSNRPANGVAGIQLFTDPSGGANSVQVVCEPVQKIVSDRASIGSYGALRWIANGGPNNFPYFRSHPTLSYNSGWDGLPIPPDAVISHWGPNNAPWMATIVGRHNALNPRTDGDADGQILKCEYGASGGGTNNYFTVPSRTDSVIYFSQGNVDLHYTEASNGLAVLNTWEIINIVCDGHFYRLYRNGVLTFTSPVDVNAGGFVTAPTAYCWFNNGKMDFAVFELSAGAPSVTQMNAMNAAKSARYGISVVAATVGPSSYIPTPASDQTVVGMLTTPNYPTDDVGLTRSDATPGGGITLKAGATQMFSYTFGAGGNIDTSAKARNIAHYHYITGNPNNQFDLDVSTGHSSGGQVFWARGRHFPPDHFNDLHRVKPNGWHLSAMSAENRTKVAPGYIWAAVARFPQSFRPGTLLKVVYRIGKGVHGWQPIWYYSGEQRTPLQFGTTDPYAQPNGRSLFEFPTYGHEFEIDVNDQYSLVDYQVPHGKHLATQVIASDSGQGQYGVVWTGRRPDRPFDSRSNGFSRDPHDHFYNVSPVDATTQDRTIYCNWRGDGSNLIDFLEIVPGLGAKVFQTAYMEYDQAPDIVDPVTGVTRKQGMHLILGNQAVNVYQYDIEHGTVPQDNDGIYGGVQGGTPDPTALEPDGWTFLVKEVSAWRGEINNVDLLRLGDPTPGTENDPPANGLLVQDGSAGGTGTPTGGGGGTPTNTGWNALATYSGTGGALNTPGSVGQGWTDPNSRWTQTAQNFLQVGGVAGENAWVTRQIVRKAAGEQVVTSRVQIRTVMFDNVIPFIISRYSGADNNPTMIITSPLKTTVWSAGAFGTSQGSDLSFTSGQWYDFRVDTVQTDATHTTVTTSLWTATDSATPAFAAGTLVGTSSFVLTDSVIQNLAGGNGICFYSFQDGAAGRVVSSYQSFTQSIGTGSSGGTATAFTLNSSNTNGASETAPTNANAYFVAPNGSDSAAGTKEAPFLTIEKARDTVGGDSARKTICFRGGTYPTRTTNAQFVPWRDNGIKLTRYPGEVPILDFGGTVANALYFDAGCTNITINGLTILHPVTAGIQLNGYQNASISGFTITNNHIRYVTGDTSGGAGATGGIRGSFCTDHNLIANNLIEDTVGPSITFVGGSNVEYLKTMTIRRNICRRANNLGFNDTGMIYFLDRGHNGDTANPTIIEENWLEDAGSGDTRQVYFDDQASAYILRRNILTGDSAIPLQYHGGDHLVVEHNLIDVTGSRAYMALYQDVVSQGLTNLGMAGNTFQGNVVYNGRSTFPNSTLWAYFITAGQTVTNPATSGNLYFQTTGTLPNAGSIVDSSPHVANPNFVSASTKNYNFSDGGTAAAAATGFTPIDYGVIGPQ